VAIPPLGEQGRAAAPSSAAGAGPGPEVFAPPARAATAGSLAAAVGVLAVQFVVPGGWGAAAWVPLVAGLLVGLPHGAVDHLVPGYRLGWRLRVLGLFALGYAALAAAAWLGFRAFPAGALGLFVLVSAWHFGSGETAFADLRAGRPVRRRVLAPVAVGVVVLVVPLARGTGTAAGRQVLDAVVPGASAALPPTLPAAVVAAGTAAGGVLAAVLLARGRRLEAAELAVLLAVALVVPPLAAFGTYFGFWHSLRHVARVVAEDPANAGDLGAGRWARPLGRFALAAALPTAAVLAVLGLLWAAADGWRGFVATDVPLLAALTLPHVLVVGWLDRAEGRALDAGQPGDAPPGSRRMGTWGMPSST
jgi:Brp/Blh family beta-carotene 15,15'-monooxygenase